MSVGTLLPILVLYWLSGTGDLRRAMVGVTLLLFALSIAALNKVGPMNKLRVVLIGAVPLLQVWYLLPVCVGLSPPARVFSACCGPSLEAPFRGQDGNELMSDVLARRLPEKSVVAAYTLALFSYPDRVYEPAALQLGLAARKTAINVGYLWDEGAYDRVIGRLAQSGYRFLLLDTWDNEVVRQSHMLYVHFTAGLLDSLRQRDNHLPGLRLVDTFTVSGRKQLLFEITTKGLVPNAYPDDALSWSQQNIAAARTGARAVTTNHQSGFDGAFLNDNSPEAWGSAETLDDVFAGVVLPKPQVVQIVRIILFSPGQRAHLRDLSIVARIPKILRSPTGGLFGPGFKGSGPFRRRSQCRRFRTTQRLPLKLIQATRMRGCTDSGGWLV